MKIYIAGRLSQRGELHEIRKKLWQLGHDVVSTWIDEGGDFSKGDGGLTQGKKVAIRDLAQIATADLLILDTTSPISYDGGGGREFEFGFAVAQYQYKQEWRVGPVKNAFHYLVDREFETWKECLIYLKEIYK